MLVLESVTGDRHKVIMEHKEDEMLSEVRKQADTQEGGYSWQDSLLVHSHT